MNKSLDLIEIHSRLSSSDISNFMKMWADYGVDNKTIDINNRPEFIKLAKKLSGYLYGLLELVEDTESYLFSVKGREYIAFLKRNGYLS